MVTYDVWEALCPDVSSPIRHVASMRKTASRLYEGGRVHRCVVVSACGWGKAECSVTKSPLGYTHNKLRLLVQASGGSMQ